MDAESRTAIRTRIDELDERLLELIAERRRLGGQIAAAKVAEGRAVRDPEREAAVLEKARGRAQALGLRPDVAEKLMALLIDDSLKAQRARLDARAADEGEGPVAVAYLGGPGAYSHLAVHAHFGDRPGGITDLGQATFADVVAAVEDARAIYGMLPIENTTTGTIGETYDLLLDSRLSIVGEHHLRVDHALIGAAENLAPVKTVFGHPQAIAQCRRFLTKNGLSTRFAGSTARALERAQAIGPEAAAIAGPEAAARFALNLIARGVADYPETYTRFVALARDATPPPTALSCKTSVVFSTADEAGSLLAALAAFEAEGVNLTKLESRPIPGNAWEERFFADFEGHVQDERVERAVANLRRITRTFRVLGCYGADRLALAGRG